MDIFSEFRSDVNIELNKNLLPGYESRSKVNSLSLRDTMSPEERLASEQTSSIQVALNKADFSTRNDKEQLIALIEGCQDHSEHNYHSPDPKAVLDRIPQKFHGDTDVFSALLSKAQLNGHLPEELRENKQFMKDTIINQGSHYTQDFNEFGREIFKEDVDFAVKFFHQNSRTAPSLVGEELRETNREIAICCVCYSPTHISQESDFFADKDFYMRVANLHLEKIHDLQNLDGDNTIFTEIRKLHDDDFFCHFDPELLSDKDVVMMEASINPKNLKYASNRLQNDWDVAKVAVATAKTLGMSEDDTLNSLGKHVRQTIQESGVDPFTYVDKLQFKEKLEQSILIDDDQEEPVQKLGKERGVDSSWDDSGKVHSMDEAQARMKAIRERSMGTKQKI